MEVATFEPGMRALVGAATAMEAMETVAPGWVAVETVTRRVASGMQKAEATARRRAVGNGRRMGAVATGRCAEAARAVVGERHTQARIHYSPSIRT